MRSLIALALVTTFIGCASAPRARDHALNPGRVDCEPSMDCLPDPDVPAPELSQSMRFGQMLAAGTFRVAPPAAPGETEDVRRWWNEVLEPWVAQRVHVVEVARLELDRAAEEDHRQRIIGGAVVGMMYEDVAHVLSSIPAPSELESEPEIREIYESTLRSRARTFVEHARRAYSACAQNAVSPSSMRHWSRFCAARSDRLPEAQDWQRLRSGETIVEVIAQ